MYYFFKRKSLFRAVELAQRLTAPVSPAKVPSSGTSTYIKLLTAAYTSSSGAPKLLFGFHRNWYLYCPSTQI